MIRDIELAKAICRAIATSRAETDADAIPVDGAEPWRIARHVDLMVQAGIVDALPGPRAIEGQKVYRVRGLTAYGQAFAASLDDAKVWAELEALFPNGGIQQIPLRVIAGLAPRMAKA